MNDQIEEWDLDQSDAESMSIAAESLDGMDTDRSGSTEYDLDESERKWFDSVCIEMKPREEFMAATKEGKFDMMYDLYEQELRKVAQQLVHPADNIEPVTEEEEEEFAMSNGQFWQAIMEIRARTSMTPAEQLIKWIPKTTEIQDHGVSSSSFLPSTLGISLKAFAKNAPYLRKKLTLTRKMNLDNFHLLSQECPTEVRVKNCSWLTEDQFKQSLQSCQTENLRVLQLDLCGQSMFDSAIKNKLAQSANNFSKLAILSLRGSISLEDSVLDLLGPSVPSLQSINLGRCSNLTATAVEFLADHFSKSLRELYIDNCHSINALYIEHCIHEFEKLEVFSVAGLAGVSDGFISKLVSACGKTLLELDLADCNDLTDDSLTAIATNCPGLLALNISKLVKLTNVGMGFLADKCKSIRRLNLTRTKFSDEVIAAFLETSGESLEELSLNSVARVGPNTALSLARKSRRLAYLDISFCQGISNEALGLIVDSCSSLKYLKVFGCRQINAVFLHGHSNELLRVLGYGLMPLLDHIELIEPDELLLRFSSLPDPIDSWYQTIQQREGRA